MNIQTLEERLPHYFRLAQRLSGGGILAYRPVRLPSGGTEATNLRDYTPGDDPWHIDWGICARHDELRVREYAGTARRHATLLLDASSNLALSSRAKETQRTAALTLAYCLLAQGALLEVGAFSQTLTLEPPYSGTPRMGALHRFLRELQPRPESVDFTRTISAFLKRRHLVGDVFVLSDFFAGSDSFQKDFQEGLERLMADGCTPRVIHLLNAENRADHMTGDVEIIDAKGFHRVITLTESDLQAYQKRYFEYLDSVQTYCRGHAIPYTRVESDATPHVQILTALGLPANCVS